MRSLGSGRAAFSAGCAASWPPVTLAGSDGTALVARLRPAPNGDAGFLPTTEMAGAFALGFRTTRLLALFTLPATRVLPLAGTLGFLVVLLLRTFLLVGLAFRRGGFGLL